MNTVKAITPQTETQRAAAQSKSKTRADGGDFLDMLAGAMESKAKKPEIAARETGKTGAGRAAGAEKPSRNKAADNKDTQSASGDAQIDAAANAVAANAAAQIQAETRTDTQADITDESVAVTVQTVLTMQVIPAQTPVQPEAAIPAQTAQHTDETVQAVIEEPVHTQATNQKVQADGAEQAARTDRTAAENPDARNSPIAGENPVVAEAARNAERPQSRHESRTARQTEAENRTIPEEAADEIVSTRVVRQTAEAPETQAERQTEVMSRQPKQDAAQAKFDGMLERARQELDNAKTMPVREVSAETQTAVEPEVTADTPQVTANTPVVTEKEPETAIPEEEAETLRTDNAESKSETAEAVSGKPAKRPEQPVKTGIKTGETIADIIHPGTRQISTPEAARTEPQAPAQTARTPDQSEQIRAQVVQNLEDEKMEFNMQLHPQELGKVNVKMVLEGGKLAIEIVAANAKSAEILNKQTEALVSSLRLGNLEVTTVNVVTAGENASGHMDGEYNPGNFQGQAGRQNAQGSDANAGGRGGQGEASGQPEDETQEGRPKGILNYSI